MFIALGSIKKIPPLPTLPLTEEGCVEEISGFLNGWIENHIKGTDRDYVPFFKDLGVT